jgi:ATP-dependent helicase/nuclease subunit B
MHLRLGKYLDSGSHDPRQKDAATIGTLTTGPRGFLSWFAPLMGVVEVHDEASRVAGYQDALGAVLKEQSASSGGKTLPFYSTSFAVDPIGVSKRLLNLREVLLVSAPSTFCFENYSAKSARLVALSKVEREFLKLTHEGGEVFVLKKILANLRMGIISPIKEIELLEEENHWPVLWQELWRELSKSRSKVNGPSQAREACGVVQTDLNTAQVSILGKASAQKGKFKGDQSLLHIRSLSVDEAADAVAAYLKLIPNQEVVVIRGMDPRSLDQGLSRLGMPALGHNQSTSAPQISSLLAMVIELSVGPTDPNALLEFFCLSPSSLPQWLRKAATKNLNQKPGWPLGTGAKVLAEYLVSVAEWQGKALLKENSQEAEGPLDSDDDLEESQSSATKTLDDQARWLRWLSFCEISQPQGVTLDGLSGNLEMITEFASRAIKRQKLSTADRNALASLRNDVRDFSTLLSKQHEPGTMLSRLDLHKALSQVQRPGSLQRSRDQSQVFAVDHPSGLLGPADTVIYWMGVQSSALRGRWNILVPSEIKELGDSGVQILPTSTQDIEQTRSICNAVSFAKKNFILVTSALIGDQPEEPLPVWYDILHGFEAETEKAEVSVRGFMDGLFANLGGTLIDPDVKIFPSLSPVWEIPAGSEPVRRRESPSSLEKLLGCPLRWILGYQSNISEPPGHSYEIGPMLFGNIAHRVMQLFFEVGGLNKQVLEQRKMLDQFFEKTLEELGGMLLIPGREQERIQTKTTTIDGALALADVLNRSGFEVESCELDMEDETTVGLIGGRVDLVVKSIRNPSEKVIIDYKWGGRTGREDDVKQGLHTQLVTYSRVLGKGTTWPKTAFFVLQGKSMITVHEDLFEGVRAVKGPTELVIWAKIEAEIIKTRKELASGKVTVGIPAENYQDLEKSGRKYPAPCTYCHYDMFCRQVGGKRA